MNKEPDLPVPLWEVSAFSLTLSQQLWSSSSTKINTNTSLKGLHICLRCYLVTTGIFKVRQSKSFQKAQSFSPALVKCLACAHIFICSILWPATEYPPATRSHPTHLCPPRDGGENGRSKSVTNNCGSRYRQFHNLFHNNDELVSENGLDWNGKQLAVKYL